MGLGEILKIISKCFICNSNSSCGSKDEDSDSVKENVKKRYRKKNKRDDKYLMDTDEVNMLIED